MLLEIWQQKNKKYFEDYYYGNYDAIESHYVKMNFIRNDFGRLVADIVEVERTHGISFTFYDYYMYNKSPQWSNNIIMLERKQRQNIKSIISSCITYCNKVCTLR